MSRTAFMAAMAFGALASTPAMSCTPWVAIDPVTGREWSSRSPEAFRREQAGWRAEADTVFVAQAREARMVTGGEIEFTFTPVLSVYGEALPDTQLVFRWHPGNTCNAFTLELTDLVVIYADVDQFGWGVVGLTVPDQLQEPPPDFARRMRDIRRGVIPGPAFPD